MGQQGVLASKSAESAGPEKAARSPREPARGIPPSHAGPAAMGNQALSRLLQSGRIRAKLVVGASNDPLEKEADRVADSIDQPSAAIAVSRRPSDIMRQKSQSFGGGEPAAMPGGGPGTNLESDVQTASQGGTALEPSVRGFMEARMGTDLSGVKIHNGPLSAQLNRDLNSFAFAYNKHIHFGDGKYDPHSPSGRRLLAHELTHVVQQGASGNGSLIQRDGDDDVIAYPFKVPEDLNSNAEGFRLANQYVFGSDKQVTWVDSSTKDPFDFTEHKGKTISLRLPRQLIAQNADPNAKKAREDSKKALAGLQGKQKAEIQAEADKRFAERSGEKPGGKGTKSGEGASQMRDQALADVMKDKAALESLPLEIRDLLGPPAAYKPADFQHLLKIVEKLKQFTKEDLTTFKLLTVRGTTDADKFEKAVDLFLTKKEEIKKALETELQKKSGGANQGPPAPGAATQPPGKDPSLQEVFDEKLKDVDAATLKGMTESQRYEYALQKTNELTSAQLKFMKDHPGETAKDFAKSLNPIGTAGDTFKGIGKDLQEVANGDANAWGRWAAGTGAGAKLSGWLLAVAGVLLVASYLTGIGEVATIAAAAGYLLTTTLVLSAAESDLRIKAASQATTPEEFNRNVQLAAVAQSNLILGIALIVIAMVLHFTAKAFFPETLKKISTSMKNFRERVQLKGSVYELKPGIKAEMGSLKGELAKSVDSAKAKTVAAAEDLEKLSTEQFAEKLEKGDNGGYLDSTKATMDQKVDFKELLKTPEGRAALENIKARLVEVLKVDVPKELARLAQEYASNIDEFLKAVDEAKNHDDLKAALDGKGAKLNEEHLSQFLQEEQAKVTNQKIEETAAQNQKQAVKLAKDSITARIRAKIAGNPDFDLIYTDAELEGIVAKGKSLGFTDRAIQDLIQVGSRIKKAIPAAELLEQMDNAVLVAKRGFPFKFSDLAAFKRFAADLIASLKTADVPTDDVRIQGSALRKPTANDIDIAVFVEESSFDKLLSDRFDSKVRKNGADIALKGKTHAELAKIASDIETSPKESYNGTARTFWRAFKNGTFNSHGDVLVALKSVQKFMAGKYPELNIETVSVSAKGAAFELKPDLPVKAD